MRTHDNFYFILFKKLVVISLVAYLTPRIASATTANKISHPNVIVIYTDDQGYGDASCFNKDSQFVTPNIDRLAQEGVLFTDGHCSDTVCTPSRYGLLTGRYSWRTELKRGVFQAERHCLISDQRMTVASFLRANGISNSHGREMASGYGFFLAPEQRVTGASLFLICLLIKASIIFGEFQHR